MDRSPNGRLLMTEERTFEISADTEVYTIDLTSRITATKWDLTLGPTRHAYFSFRVAESIAVTSGGTVQSDAGDTGGDLITANGAHWVDYSGPARRRQHRRTVGLSSPGRSRRPCLVRVGLGRGHDRTVSARETRSEEG